MARATSLETALIVSGRQGASTRKNTRSVSAGVGRQPGGVPHGGRRTGERRHTDGWEGYDGLAKAGYRHRVTVLRERPNAPDLLPRVHRVVGLLKRWLLGTHQGGVSAAHLDDYLDEFTFRFNRRRSRHRGKLFSALSSKPCRWSRPPTKPWSSTCGAGECPATRYRGHLS